MNYKYTYAIAKYNNIKIDFEGLKARYSQLQNTLNGTYNLIRIIKVITKVIKF